MNRTQWLEKENQHLRGLLRNISLLVSELCEKFPPELQELDNIQGLMKTMGMIVLHLNKTEGEYGPAIQAPRNSTDISSE